MVSAITQLTDHEHYWRRQYCFDNANASGTEILFCITQTSLHFQISGTGDHNALLHGTDHYSCDCAGK